MTCVLNSQQAGISLKCKGEATHAVTVLLLVTSLILFCIIKPVVVLFKATTKPLRSVAVDIRMHEAALYSYLVIYKAIPCETIDDVTLLAAVSLVVSIFQS